MKAQEFRSQSDDELLQTLEGLQRDLGEMRVRRGQGEDPDQPMKLRGLRRDIARVKTIMKERELKND